MELNEFVKYFADQFEDTDLELINADTEYQKLEEWSSLTVLAIIAFVRTKYAKRITASDLRSCHTVGELFNLVKLR